MSRPHYGSELADALEVSEATVSRHTDRLIELGLARTRDSDRVWAYYELVPEGEQLARVLYEL